jgi:uncharacterized SAM-binding protein YcdF (DUF218 family)
MAAVTSSIKRLFRILKSRWLRRALAVIFGLWLLSALLLLLTIIIYSRTDHAQTADVIIVLGAGLNADNTPGPALHRRTAQGAAVWREGYAAQLICAGGFGLSRTRSEADACAELLRAEGIPDAAIIIEDRSRSTEENALYTLEIMQANDWDSAILVSDGYHLLRAHWLFNKLNIENYPSPAVDPPFDNLVVSLTREIMAFHWHVFKDLFNVQATYVPVL